MGINRFRVVSVSDGNDSGTTTSQVVVDVDQEPSEVEESAAPSTVWPTIPQWNEERMLCLSVEAAMCQAESELYVGPINVHFPESFPMMMQRESFKHDPALLQLVGKHEETVETHTQCLTKFRRLEDVKRLIPSCAFLELQDPRDNKESCIFLRFFVSTEGLDMERIAFHKDVHVSNFAWTEHHTPVFDVCRSWPAHVIPYVKSRLDRTLTILESRDKLPRSSGCEISPDFENFFNTNSLNHEDDNDLIRETLLEKFEYIHLESGVFSVGDSLTPYSVNRFDDIGMFIPPRQQVFLTLMGCADFATMGQMESISSFTPGSCSPTESMYFQNNPRLYGVRRTEVHLPTWWGNRTCPNRPHRFNCMQVTSENIDSVSAVLLGNKPEDIPMAVLANREDFVEHMILHGASLEIIHNLDLVHFIPTCGMIQWSMVHGLMYHSPNFGKFYQQYHAFHEHYDSRDPPFWSQYQVVFHASNLDSIFETIESGQLKAGPYGTEEKSGFFCCSQKSLASLFSYLPFHNHEKHSRKRFLFGAIVEYLVRRDDCKFVQDDPPHPTDLDTRSVGYDSQFCLKEGSFNIPLRIWIGGVNVYQNFSEGLQGWCLLDRDSLMRIIHKEFPSHSYAIPDFEQTFGITPGSSLANVGNSLRYRFERKAPAL